MGAMARQSVKDRADRLKSGCCPIHGIDMPQIGIWGDDERRGALVGCPRRDCNVMGVAEAPGGPVELLPEFRGLLGTYG